MSDDYSPPGSPSAGGQPPQMDLSLFAAHRQNQETAAAIALRANRAAAAEILLHAQSEQQRQHALLTQHALAAQHQTQVAAVTAHQQHINQVTAIAAAQSAQATMINELRAQGVPEYEAQVRARQAHAITFGTAATGALLDDKSHHSKDSRPMETVPSLPKKNPSPVRHSADALREAQLDKMRRSLWMVNEGTAEPPSKRLKKSDEGDSLDISSASRRASGASELSYAATNRLKVENIAIARLLLSGGFRGSRVPEEVYIDHSRWEEISKYVKARLASPAVREELFPEEQAEIEKLREKISSQRHANQTLRIQVHHLAQQNKRNTETEATDDKPLSAALEAEKRKCRELKAQVSGLIKKVDYLSNSQQYDTKTLHQMLDSERRGRAALEGTISDLNTKIRKLKGRTPMTADERDSAKVRETQRNAESALRAYMRATVCSLKTLCHEKEIV